jgi:lysophospholipase L1-like esterase
LRQIIHTSIGGSKARVVLSNAYGTAPLTVGAASIALRDGDAAVHPSSVRPLTFSGRPTITIPANATVYSDGVDLTVPPMADLAIDLYLPGATNSPSPVTMHNTAFQTSYVSDTGNHVGKANLSAAGTIQSWFFLSRVEVVASDATGAVVTFGDSITDGTRSTPNTNSRWPDHLARRMLSRPVPLKLGVLNAGIGGNRVLSEGAFNAGINALARFEIDVLSQSGVTHVINLEGINDIGNARQNPTPTAEDVIAGHRQLIERARSRGLKVLGIRTSNAYDAVIDFDRATRDPDDPKKFLAAFDSCDHLHPSDAGYRAMAEAVDLALFEAARVGTSTSR